jgi:putative ABC transport system ATP-binding protein
MAPITGRTAGDGIMSTYWLHTVDLCRFYRRGPQEIRAVDSVSLRIERGEFLGIVGASGSGKSTMLNLLAGLDTPTSGEIEVDGIRLGSLSRHDLAAYRAHRVGMVFQSFNLIAHRTAVENVELALYFNKTSRRDRRRGAVEILERLGLDDRLDHRPADLSGGEQQRVAIARALVKKPEILFADEPTGNLDRDNSLNIAEVLMELNRTGLTVIMATHDLDMAQQCAHRTVRMHYGRLIDDGKDDQRP